MRHNRPTFLILLLVIALLAGCSRKKDSWVNRTYRQGVSRFNIYFNGEEAYKKGVATIENGHIDDYYKLLTVFKWGDEKLRQSVVPDMDRAVEKGTKVIQTQSMDIKGKEKNKYVVMSYMLIGKARFYKGDYFPALETFNFIITKFGKTKAGSELALEANLWAAKCQVQIGNNPSASNYLDEVYRNKKLEKTLHDQVAATKAQMNIYEKSYDDAYTNLREAVLKSSSKHDKIRWIYIMGQIQEMLGNKYEASSHFKKVVSMKPTDYDMLFTAQLKRALNFDVDMENAEVVYRELQRMLDDDKNYELRDQIYYVMALIAISEEDYSRADEYLKNSVRVSVSNKKQKGESFTKMAEISFQFKEYIEAQLYYDSAYATLPNNHEKYEEVGIRKESLTELVKHINVITVEDSLQRLSNMSLARQTKLIEQYIEDLKEEEERLKEEEELRKLNQQLASQSQNLGGGPSVGTQGGWYFYNESVRASGISSFQQIWGDRKLEDNWRQKNKSVDQIVDANIQQTDTIKTKTTKPGEPTEAQKYDPAFYLAQIPKTKEDIDSSNKRILNAYIALGKIYYQKLNDWPESVSAYKKSISRFPGNIHEPRTLYNLFLLYSKQKLDKEAEETKAQLVNKYPDSEYAILLTNPDRFNEKSESYTIASAEYEKCFELFSSQNYRSCLSCISKSTKKLKENPIISKFDLLKAYCIGKTKKQTDFEKALAYVVETYPGSAEASAAQNTLDQIGGIVAQQNTLKNSPYKEKREEKHRFIVIVFQKGINLNKVRNEVTDYNSQYHKFEKLTVQNIFLDGQTQMMMVTGLEDAKKAEKYMKGILMNDKIMGYLPNEGTKKMLVSETNFKILYDRKNVQEYLDFFFASYNIN